ncbi:MAG: RNA polymerase sigma factor [Gemmataceae bacterium]
MFITDYVSNFVQDSSDADVEDIGGSVPAKTAEEVFHAYAPRVYRVARGILGNDADAEDVAQDVLLQVVRGLDAFRGDCTLGTWLHRITVNAALQHRRRQQRWYERRVSVPLEVLLNGDKYTCRTRLPAAPDQEMLQGEMRGLIESAIAQLPEMYRDVYILADIEGLGNEEIGQMLGVTVPAIKSRLHRARRMMRKVLGPHFLQVG